MTQIIWRIGAFLFNLQLPKLPMGFLTTLDHIAHIIYAKMAKKLNERNSLTLPKIRQPILAYTSFFLAHTGQKGAPPPPPPILFRVKLRAAKGEGVGGRRKQGLEENADPGLFNAGVRHFMHRSVSFWRKLKPKRAVQNLFTFTQKI